MSDMNVRPPKEGRTQEPAFRVESAGTETARKVGHPGRDRDVPARATGMQKAHKRRAPKPREKPDGGEGAFCTLMHRNPQGKCGRPLAKGEWEVYCDGRLSREALKTLRNN